MLHRKKTLMMTLTPTDKTARTLAGMITAVCAVVMLSPLFPAWPTRTAAEARPTVQPTVMIVVTATPPLPTAPPTAVPTLVPTDAPAPVVQADPPTPVVVYVEVPVEIAPTDAPAAEAHEVAPGIDHGSRPSQRGPNTAGPGMPEATPQP